MWCFGNRWILVCGDGGGAGGGGDDEAGKTDLMINIQALTGKPRGHVPLHACIPAEVLVRLSTRDRQAERHR